MNWHRVSKYKAIRSIRGVRSIRTGLTQDIRQEVEVGQEDTSSQSGSGIKRYILRQVERSRSAVSSKVSIRRDVRTDSPQGEPTFS